MENKQKMIVIADPLSKQALDFLEQTADISVSRCSEKDGSDFNWINAPVKLAGS